MSRLLRLAAWVLVLCTGLARAQTEIIIDNTDAGFSLTGNWLAATHPSDYYGTNYRLHNVCSGACNDTATWSFSLPTSGSYSLYAWWPSGSSLNSPNPQYTVNHAAGTTAVTVNQRLSGGFWRLLGTFTFNQGVAYSVSIMEAANGQVAADAIRLVAGSPQPALGPFSFEPTADAYTSADSPSSNFGSGQTMRLRNDGSHQQWGYIKFDLNTVASNVTSAVLKLTGHGPSGSTTVGVYPVADTSWGETTITWNNQPAPGANPVATATIAGTTNHTYTWDITSYVRTEKAAGRNVISLAVKAISTSSTADWVFNTKQASSFHPTISGTSLPAPLNFVHVDHLNTPRLVADAAGTTVWRWDQQEPFGSNPADQNPSGLGVFDLPLRLPGQTYDAETGLHYNYFRDYDPSLGIYKQSDPIGLRGGINTYAYVSGSPLRNIDPFGLHGMCFDFVVRSLESFDYKILSTVGDCPPQFLISGFFNPTKQLPGQRFTKTCDSGQCVNRKDVSQISWTSQEFEFSLCWTYGGTVAFNVPCIKGQRSCRVKIEITTKGSVQGWTGECQC